VKPIGWYSYATVTGPAPPPRLSWVPAGRNPLGAVLLDALGDHVPSVRLASATRPATAGVVLPYRLFL
jgi:hypothetical protein